MRMRASVLWAFVADQFIIDRFGKYSIIGIWDGITASNFPAVHPLLFIVVGWKGDPLTTVMAETRIWTPAGTLLLTSGVHPMQLSPAGKGIDANQIMQTQFPQFGIYRIELIGDGEVKHQFEISLMQAPQMMQGSTGVQN